jgi:dynactin-5
LVVAVSFRIDLKKRRKEERKERKMLYCPESNFIKEDFIVTSTGNIINRLALISKPQAVEIPNGKVIVEKDVIIRGDFAPIQLNKYCYIDSQTVIRPAYTLSKGAFRFIPVTIGSHSYIGKNCVIQAAVIGVGCLIEDDVVLSKRCILKDFVYVMAGSVVPPDMVCPPFSIVEGSPAQIVGEQPESTSTVTFAEAVARYKAMKAVDRVSETGLETKKS